MDIQGKQLRMHLGETLGLPYRQVEEHILRRLTDSGFDMTKPIERHTEMVTGDLIFRQRTEGMRGADV